MIPVWDLPMARHRRRIELIEAGNASASDGPVSITTFGALVRFRHRLSGMCRKCDAFRAFDAASRPADEVFVGRTFRCRDCGSEMEISVSPPAWERRD